MKRYGYIFEKIVTMENLRLAHEHAKKGKSFYREVKMVDSDIDHYLREIQTMLINGTYVVSEYTHSVINDKGKERDLMKLPYYPDRIIQWAIMLQIEPIFTSTLCYHSCASIPKKGIKIATKMTRKYVKDSEYCLKIDVRHFYASINRSILKKLLRRKFKDPKLLKILDDIIDSMPGETGVPIGSYLSQYLANFYLSSFDHWVKEELHIHKTVRYMDDCTFYLDTKEQLHEVLPLMSKFLGEHLALELKGNYQVFPIDARGVDFVGYRHFHGFNLLRKSTCKRYKRCINKMLDKQDRHQLLNYSEFCSANSYNGMLKWCNSYRLRNKYVIKVFPLLLRYYKMNIASKMEESKRGKAIRRYKRRFFKGRKVVIA